MFFADDDKHGAGMQRMQETKERLQALRNLSLKIFEERWKGNIVVMN